MIDLDKLMRLREAATPGPWGHKIDDAFTSIHTIEPSVASYVSPADAAYICAACGAVPELVKRVRELEDAAGFEARVAKKLSDPFWNYAVAERYFELALPYRRLPAAVLLKAARLEVEADMIREGKGPGSSEEE